ncbi:acylphosphatase [Psychromonas sp. MME2]|uniref:acylphosphatase n=1 Tax=unclassified Psychromonas TaxID=2614957 RepID=UPI00339C8409
MSDIGCKVIVTGHVQGVGFRYFTLKEAQLYGLTGHAKNLNNGNVEVLLYGDRDDIDKMVKWLSMGPKTARVDEVQVTEVPYCEELDFNCG